MATDLLRQQKNDFIGKLGQLTQKFQCDCNEYRNS